MYFTLLSKKGKINLKFLYLIGRISNILIVSKIQFGFEKLSEAHLSTLKKY